MEENMKKLVIIATILAFSHISAVSANASDVIFICYNPMNRTMGICTIPYGTEFCDLGPNELPM